MADKGHDRAGTWTDWPVLVIALGVGLWLFVTLGGGTPTLWVYLLVLFGVIALLIRRGAFTPRR